jgi:ribosomal protein S18 acetylase RimI-like enzyme
VEQARLTWGLPGSVAFDGDGNVVGWSFHHVQNGVVRIGGLVADTITTTRRLVDHLVEIARSRRAFAITCFVAARAPGLANSLESRGLSCEPFHYMLRPLDAASADLVEHRSPCETWDQDIAAAGALLACVYPASESLHFTTSGAVDEWQDYVESLVGQPACGALDAACTIMARDDRGLAGLAIVTTLAPDTAHVAQIAVRRDRQGQGLARRLLREAMQRAARQGRTAMTLLVGDGNARALRVYRGEGFQHRAAFLAARAQLDTRVSTTLSADSAAACFGTQSGSLRTAAGA